ncbi:MAG TPA: hypothetical protein PKA00_10020 [Saprospiraceae bacterium]|nr:hypothetical protein [Saprospiraceae bacterium]HMQ83234.1 hypothetical protein [Saprospiraceae bacterium]
MVNLFSFEIESGIINRWSKLATSSAIFGGILIVQMLDSNRVRCLPLYWQRGDDANPVRPVFRKLRGSPTHITIPTDGFPGRNPDEVLIEKLRGDDSTFNVSELEQIERSINLGSVFIPDSADADTRLNPILTPTVEIQLAFLDAKICDYLANSTNYYYRERDASGDYRYYLESSASTVRTPVTTSDRKILFKRALAIVHPDSPSSASTTANSYWALSASPLPTPVLNEEDNTAGAVAYLLTPSCPPYWRPSSEPLHAVMGLLASSLTSARLELDAKKKAGRERLIWIILLIILSLVVANNEFQLLDGFRKNG